MRMSPSAVQPTSKERKVSQSASCKIDSIIKQLFLPMLGMPTPERTSVRVKPSGPSPVDPHSRRTPEQPQEPRHRHPDP